MTAAITEECHRDYIAVVLCECGQVYDRASGHYCDLDPKKAAADSGLSRKDYPAR